MSLDEAVNASDIPIFNSSESVRAALGAWLKTTNLRAVTVTEELAPSTDTSDDYAVAYEIRCVSDELDKLNLHLYALNNGHVGLGIETRDRVAKRCGTFSLKSGYLLGHEPGPISGDEVRTILQACASGALSISVRHGVFGLSNAKAYLAHKSTSMFAGPHWRWLEIYDENSMKNLKILNYQPW